MKRRRRIGALSEGKISIKRFRAQERKAAGKPAIAEPTTPTRHVPTQRTPEQLAKLSPAQRLYVEKGIVSSSIEGARKMERTFAEKEKQALGTQQTQAGVITPTQEQPTAQLTEQAQPTVDPNALNQNLINQDLVAQQVQGAVPVPENFVKDVAIATGIGAAAIAAGTVAIATAAIIPAVTADGVALIATKGLAAKTVSSAASGKLTSSVIKETIKLGGGRIQINTYTAGKITSWIGKLASSFKNPAFVAGAIGSYIFSVGFSFNEGQGDIATTLKIAHRDALEKNPELAKEIAQQMNDVWSLANVLQNFIPIGNFFLADWRKVKATNKIIQAEQEFSETGILSPEDQKWADINAKKEAEEDWRK